MTINDLPYAKGPCGQCPFRKESLKSWLGGVRASEIANSTSFVCHKNTTLQCAGHMVVCENNNEFVKSAEAMFGEKIQIKNMAVLFDTPDQFINHHERE